MAEATARLTATLVSEIFGLRFVLRRVDFVNLPLVRFRAMIRLGGHVAYECAEYRLDRAGGRLSNGGITNCVHGFIEKVGYVIENLGHACDFVGDGLGLRWPFFNFGSHRFFHKKGKTKQGKQGESLCVFYHV